MICRCFDLACIALDLILPRRCRISGDGLSAGIHHAEKGRAEHPCSAMRCTGTTEGQRGRAFRVYKDVYFPEAEGFNWTAIKHQFLSYTVVISIRRLLLIESFIAVLIC